IDPSAVRVHGVSQDDHGGWTYQTVLASAAAPLAVAAVSEETSEVAWVPVTEVDQLELHPGFASQWPSLQSALAPLTVVVDAANVMGSRPDGWWRDRAAAASRLCDEIAGLALDGVTSLPESVPGAVIERWYPRFVIVLEGAAAAGVARDGGSGARAEAANSADAADSADAEGTSSRAAQDATVRLVRATGSGDEEIVRQAALAVGAGSTVVVTADRELRARCEACGASVTGPRWLLGLL
ncbi:MAG TPA: hypothetical protein VF834_00725, partial [Streptosporangiaceae bacterium]